MEGVYKMLAFPCLMYFSQGFGKEIAFWTHFRNTVKSEESKIHVTNLSNTSTSQIFNSFFFCSLWYVNLF